MKSSYIIKHLLGSILFFAILFVCAGRLDYWQGLIYVAIGLIMVVLNYTVLKPDPDLMKEREKPGKDSKKWDKNILGLSLLFTVLMYLFAGLDSGRFYWSPDFHWILYLLGGVLTATGQLLFLIAQKQNKFFSSTVRIQTERNHQVCTTGLYRIVRHPAYLGNIIQLLGFPLLFGSLWSIVPVIVSLALIVIRTFFEDKTLKNELNGYTQYAATIKFRLIPFLW